MAASVYSTSASADVPQSPKKRKITTDTPTNSKKRRKHAEEQTVELEETAAAAPPKSRTKERKSKKKEKELHENGEDVEMQDAEATELPKTLDLKDDASALEEVLVNGQAKPDVIEEIDDSLLSSQDPSCFYSKRLSLYVAVPAISLATSTSSLLSLHLAPLLLTYFPPAGGVILSFSDPVLTAKAETGVNLPLRPPISGNLPRHPPDETFSQCADQFGVCWVWLTATFLVFAPQPGDHFKGWANIQSESFIGLVSYNYFQTSVLKSRIPKAWDFDGPSHEQVQKRKGKKGKLRGENGEDDTTQETTQNVDAHDNAAISVADGSFLDENGNKISSNQSIRVNDIDMTPSSEKHRYGLQIDGSLLSLAEEKAVLAEEKRQYDAVRKRRVRSQTPAADDDVDMPLMSGGLNIS